MDQSPMRSAGADTQGHGASPRLLIIDELAAGENCVCELAEMIGADMSTVSST